MSNDRTEEFIDAVRCHPYLYDLEDSFYKDNEKKMNTWREIATKFRMKDGNEAKGKWRNLKDSYSKYKKSITTTTGQTYKKYKKWPWADYMQFLDDLNRHRQPDDSLSKPDDSLSSQHSDITGDSESIDMSRPGTSFSGSTSGKRKKDDDVRTLIEYFEKRRRETAVDQIDQLFLNYANTFKNMSKRTQISLKLKMAQIFAEAENEELISRDTMLDSIIDLPLVHNFNIMRREDAETSSARNVNLGTSPAEEINAETSPARNVNLGTPPAEEINAEASPSRDDNLGTPPAEDINAGIHSTSDSDDIICQYLKFK